MMQQVEEFCTVTAVGVYSCLWTSKVNGYWHYFSIFIILDYIELLQNTGLLKKVVGVLTTCHTQYTWDRSICIFLFDRTTLQVFVT